MALASGTQLGPYHVEGVLGAGGMGEVYRARDTRLGRTVAIKILPALAASNAESRQRFEREAKAIAALSHPHICTLYDVGEQANAAKAGADPVRFLVMEYLEGDTLEHVLRGTRLPLDRVLRIGIQCADALDRAHRTGIVHRDLKPGNIMLTPRGAVLLDFGLARMRRTAPVAGMSVEATVTSAVTDQGTILGTLHYMAPEQVEGREADERSDIFSLGTVVYEMATGQKAFEGKSAAAVMAAILEKEPPPLSAHQPDAPPLLEHLVSRCLAKNPEERWQSAGDFKRELAWFAEAGGRATAPVTVSATSRWPERFAWMGALVVLTGLAVLATMLATPRPSPPEMRLDLALPATVDPFSLAIAPDGRSVVYSATGDDGQRRLWLRILATGEVRGLRGTDYGHHPFWKPDSSAIGFAMSGQLKRIDLDSDAVRPLANAPLFMGGAWSRQNQILFVPNTNQPVLRIDADSPGQPAVVTPAMPDGQTVAPAFIPGTDSFLFYVSSPEANVRGIYLSRIDGSAVRRLFDADSPAIYAPSGHIVFGLKGALFARPWDAAGQLPRGEPVQLAEGFMSRGYAGVPVVALSVADTGQLLYRTGTVPPLRSQLAWLDRSEKNPVPIGEQRPVILNPVLSPDGRRVAMFMGGIFLFDLTSGNLTQLTFGRRLDFSAVWSPSGSEIVFSSSRTGKSGLYRKQASGAGEDIPLLTGDGEAFPTDWSADGKFLLYRSTDSHNSFDIRGLSLADGKTFTVLATDQEERDGQFSTNGKWFVYQTNESGRFEIMVRRFRTPGVDVTTDEKWKISPAGGVQPRWRRDGTEIFYVGLDGRLMAVPISETRAGDAIVRGTPVALGAPPVALLFDGGTALPSYDVTRDGQKVLMSTLPLPLVSAPATLLLNWPRTP
jgi:Tol biopolymer transport system component/tRNA A-37 threonylcarbamoyl transferase component Bud32